MPCSRPPPAPQPAQPQAPVGTAQTAPQRFTGHPVSLDFQGADLRAVLADLLRDQRPEHRHRSAIQGTVDVALRDVPWDQALDIILRANKLGYVIDGTIVRVAPLAVLAEEEAQRRKLEDEQALAGELRMLTQAAELRQGQRPAAAADGHARCRSAAWFRSTSAPTCIIINDLDERLPRATELIDTLDLPQPQVEIEARIVQTSREFARQIGVKWGVNGRVPPDAREHDRRCRSRTRAASRGRLGAQGPARSGTGRQSGSDEPDVGIGLALGSINGSFNLDVALSALEARGQGSDSVDAARVHAEQHRSRDHAGRPDSHSDGRQ